MARCAKCGGVMAKGGAVKKVLAKAQMGLNYGIPQTGTTNYSAPTMKKGGAVKKLQNGGTGMSKLEQKLRKAAGYTISDNSSGPMNSTVAQKTKKNGTTKFVEVTNIPGGGSSRQTSKTNKAKGIDNYKYVAKDKNGKVIDKTVDNIKNGQETAKKGIYFSKGGMVKKGGAVKNAKFAALAPPYNKATFADRIAGAKKKK
jgi:Zn-finger nucleic acid-binding protein